MKTKEKFQILIKTLKNGPIKEKTNFLRCVYSFFMEPDDIKSMPIFVQIEPTTRCNLKCRMCINPHIKKEKLNLELSEFKLILDRLPYLRKISFVGRGEPLLNPDIFEMIKMAKERGISIGFATNGMLLSEETSKGLVDLKPDWINISIDGATKETFEEIRKGADFDTVIKNIRMLKSITTNSGRPEVSIWFLAIQSNLKELPGMVDLCRDLGINRLSVQTAHHWGDSAWRNLAEGEFLKDTAQKPHPVFIEAFKKARENRISLDFCNIPDKDSNRGCKWPWRACYITVDGYITPCCMNGADPEIINFGNILKDDFSSIWKGEGYRKFRRQLKSKTPPSICHECTSYYKAKKQF